MKIKVNNEYVMEVNEDYLIVKDKKLYNTKTKKFEGVEGDIISFKYKHSADTIRGYRGYVDGYTNGVSVKIRGINNVFTDLVEQTIEHISTVANEDGTSFEDKELLAATEAL